MLHFYRYCKLVLSKKDAKGLCEYDEKKLGILQQGDLNLNEEIERKLETTAPRLYCVMSVFTFAFIALTLRMVDLTFMDIEDVQEMYTKHHKSFMTSRADIVDRNGDLLASNIVTASLHAHPKQIIDIKKAACEISKLDIEDLQYHDLYQKLDSGREFVWIKRHLTPSEQQKIHDLGIPGIYLSKDDRRVYTYERLFSHVIGYADIDGNGIAGIEKSYNKQLTENKGTPLQLSLDARIQNILHQELQKGVKTHSAEGGTAIAMNIKNGEILGMVSLPDFNPHQLATADAQQLFNQATLGVYEMGSTFKIFTIAIGLDSGKIAINDVFNVSQPIKIGKFQINDYKGKGGFLSVPEILMYSSNIGVSQIAKAVGIKQQKSYLYNFGLLSEIKFDTPEVGRPLYPQRNQWSEISAATISYGHGMAVTPLHLIQGVGAILNGGTLYKPTLLKYPEDAKLVGKKILKTSTAHLMRKLLRLTVENGSAKKANVEGYLVGGKTGTSEKNSKGRYQKKLNLAIFIGGFPINDPEYLVLVIVDAAKPNALNSGYTTGSMISAPIAGEIIKNIAPILGVLPRDASDPEILRAMTLDYTPMYNALAKR